MVGLVLKSVVVFVVCLAAADIVGAVAVTVFDILPLKFASAALAYAIWFVLGVFCGLYAYNIAGAWTSPGKAEGDWTAQPGARRIGTVVLVTGVLVVAGLVWLFWSLFWRQGVAGDDYVPDSAPHSIVFFVAVIGGAGVGRFLAMPAKAPAEPPDPVVR